MRRFLLAALATVAASVFFMRRRAGRLLVALSREERLT